MKFFISLLMLAVSTSLEGQVLPKEGSRLNFRMVGFSVPPGGRGAKYKLQVAAGNFYNEDSFVKNLIVSKESKAYRIFATVPKFGASYTWRVLYYGSRGISGDTTLHHFKTIMNARVDTSKYRLRLLTPGVNYGEGYVSVESAGMLYDMQGNPVWFLPDTNGMDGGVTDLRVTKEGTLTFLFFNSAYEMKPDGTIIWKSPNKDIVTGKPSADDYYHHEFIRCNNGHYMVLGVEVMKCKSVTAGDSSYLLATGDLTMKDGYKLARFGDIIEYDRDGNVVWSWESSKYLIGSDFDYFHPQDTSERFEPHDNSFYFDEKAGVIYFGFRNLNRIIKIKYPGGRVLGTYGELFKPGARSTGSGLFCNPHGVCLSKEGYILLYNNNSCNQTDSLSTILMLQQPALTGGNIKKIWEYQCNVPAGVTHAFPRGGNVIELPSGSFFVCTGANYSKLFIVSRAKKELWSAVPEKYIVQEKKWKPAIQYRSCFLDRKGLERLIWNAEE